MPTVRLDDVDIAYDDVGTGPTLTLIHGHPFNRSMWRPQLTHFAQAGWRVIAPDLRGYGDSEVVPGITTVGTFARDIAGLLDYLKVEATVLGGLSMGGQIVMELQRSFPHRVRGIALADTSAQAETEAGKELRRDTAQRLMREGMTPYADELLSKMLAPETIRRQPHVARHVLAMMRGTSPEGAAAALRGRAERPDYLEVLSEAAVPIVVVVGRDDEFTPVEDAELIQARVPGATLVVIQAAGHMPNLERPTEFNAALQGLLDAVHQPQPTRSA